jgi:hypothetical protein
MKSWVLFKVLSQSDSFSPMHAYIRISLDFLLSVFQNICLHHAFVEKWPIPDMIRTNRREQRDAFTLNIKDWLLRLNVVSSSPSRPAMECDIF